MGRREFQLPDARQHTDDQVSRIQILEDTNGDGVFDKKKTFTDKLTFTSGLACGFGGVFVGSPPNLTFIPDADGDDIPDGPPQSLARRLGHPRSSRNVEQFHLGTGRLALRLPRGVSPIPTLASQVTKTDSDSSSTEESGGITPLAKTFEIFARGLSNPMGIRLRRPRSGLRHVLRDPASVSCRAGRTLSQAKSGTVNPLHLRRHQDDPRSHSLVGPRRRTFLFGRRISAAISQSPIHVQHP